MEQEEVQARPEVELAALLLSEQVRVELVVVVGQMVPAALVGIWCLILVLVVPPVVPVLLELMGRFSWEPQMPLR